MKNIIYSVIMLAFASLAVSCQSDSELQQQSSRSTVINAVVEQIGTPGTRAEVAYKYNLLWSAGDQLYVKNNTENASFFLQYGAGTTNGTFACTTNPFAEGEEVEAFYPTSLVQNGKLVWPADQNNLTIPMYCKNTLSGSSTFGFKCLGAVLQLVVTSYSPYMKQIRIEDGLKSLSGTFTVDGEGNVVMDPSEKGSIIIYDNDIHKYNLYLGSKGPTVLNVILPPGVYEDLRITFVNGDDQECCLQSGTPLTLRQNTVSKISYYVDKEDFKDQKFACGYATAIINGKPKAVDWVQLWENGPKFATYNVGVTDGKPESDGGIYLWGGRIDDDSDWDNYNNTTLSPLSGNDDTATALWGSNWRLPTKAELDALVDNCDIETDSRHLVTKVVGRGYYSNNYIIIPQINNDNSSCIWSSTPYEEDYADVNYKKAYYLHLFYNVSESKWDASVYAYYRQNKYSVRAVLNE